MSVVMFVEFSTIAVN